MPVIPIAVLLIPYGFFVFAYLFFIFFNVFHMQKYALRNATTYLVLLLYITGTLLILALSANQLLVYDWTTPLNLDVIFGVGVEDLYSTIEEGVTDSLSQ
jgi:hypothetical protein